MKKRSGGAIEVLQSVCLCLLGIGVALCGIGNTMRDKRIEQLTERVEYLELLLAIPTDTVYPSEAP